MTFNEVINSELKLIDTSKDEQEIILLISLSRFILNQVKDKVDLDSYISKYAYVEGNNCTSNLIESLNNFDLVSYLDKYNKLDKSIKGFEFINKDSYISISVDKFKKMLLDINKILA